MAVRIEAHAEPIPGYKLLDRIGAGGFGEVWRAEAPGGIFKAIKIIHGDLRSKNSDLVRYAEQELKSIKRVKQVRHPYMLALDRYDIIDGRLLITMELADCNLWDRFREHREQGRPGIPRDELLIYMAEIAEVLDLFNDSFQLQHLDIKPQNLFLLYNHAKVADFGQVKDLQGLIAEVTGGITPVYAAPETFDGVITRYCDQYSLGCVYQELLTGLRPFDGGTLSQLLMQHLNMPPNLAPSPVQDRPALARALSKKPEDRWPSVIAFVRALAGYNQVSGRVAPPPSRATSEAPTPQAPESSTAASEAAQANPAGSSASMPRLVVPGDTPPPAKEIAETAGPVYTPAPPETTGPGPLRPSLVIGLGQTGLRVVQRLRFDLNERYGSPEATPAVRLLYVDTDQEALDDALRSRSTDRLAKLRSENVFSAKLNRPAHYIKPRLSGRSLTEGWFDPQLLYKIPRVPQTMGMRLFGRLAFCDHYRPLMGKVQAELEEALLPESLAKTETRTGLQRRTNRPLVYIVASLGGGTGGGMFLDLAYSVRVRLKRLGYDDPQVVGVLVLPSADSTHTPQQALGNAYAALTELNHFSRADTTFSANYDDRNGAVRETVPPFTCCFLVPGSAGAPVAAGGSHGSGVVAVPRSHTPAHIPAPAARVGSGAVAKPGSRVMQALPAQRNADPVAAHTALKPFADAAGLIRLHLFTSVGRLADEIRATPSEEPAVSPVRPALAAFGMCGFGWPRAEVVARTAARVAQSVLKRWTAADQKRAWEVMPKIAEDRWTKLGLSPETILGQIQRAADSAAGVNIEEQIALTVNRLVPRGWLARLPDPAHVTLAIDRLVKLLGPPVASLKRPQTAVEQAISDTAIEIAGGLALDVRTLIPVLADDPQYRLSGVEDLLNLFLNSTSRLIEQHFTAALELETRAQVGFECVSQFAHFQKGMRKPTAAEFGEAIKQFPVARFQGLMSRALVGLYHSLREVLAGQVNDVSSARQRLDAAAAHPATLPTFPEPPPGYHRLLPPGCTSVPDAVERFRKVITENDLADIDFRVQEIIEPELDGVFQACLTLTEGPERVVAAVYEETRSHLDRRLGEVDLAAMFTERYRSPQQVERTIEQSYQEAEPTWIGVGPWSDAEVAVVGCPDGPGGEPLRELARRAIPVAGLPISEASDELIVYREWPNVPLSALPHLGPAGAAAYRSLQETHQCSPHTRLDITRWADPDES